MSSAQPNRVQHDLVTKKSTRDFSARLRPSEGDGQSTGCETARQSCPKDPVVASTPFFLNPTWLWRIYTGRWRTERGRGTPADDWPHQVTVGDARCGAPRRASNFVASDPTERPAQPKHGTQTPASRAPSHGYRGRVDRDPSRRVFTAHATTRGVFPRHLGVTPPGSYA